jgi:hypothetical protein
LSSHTQGWRQAEVKKLPYVNVEKDSFYTDKKENKIFLIYKEIQIGAVAKSYMRKVFIIM